MKTLNDVHIKVGKYGIWHNVLTVEIDEEVTKVCWPDQSWETYPSDSVQIQQPNDDVKAPTKIVHQVSEDDFINESFDKWMRENDLEISCAFRNTRQKYFKMFMGAFTRGAEACTNGDYY